MMSRSQAYFGGLTNPPGISGTIARSFQPSRWDITQNAAHFAFSNNDQIATRGPLATGTNQCVIRNSSHSLTGRFYFEIQTNFVIPGPVAGVGNASVNLNSYCGSDANSWGFAYNATKLHNAVITGYGTVWATGDIIGVKVDFDSDELRFTRNGIDEGLAYSGISGQTLYPIGGEATNGNTLTLNSFGPFAFSPGGGFVAWG